MKKIDFYPEYILDGGLSNKLNQMFNENFVRIINMFQSLVIINTNDTGVNVYVDKVERRLIDIIATSNNEDDAKYRVMNYIKKMITAVFSWTGVKLSDDIDVWVAIELVNVYSLILEKDRSLSTETLDILRSYETEENIEVFVSLFEEYTTYPECEIFDAIDNVKDIFFYRLIKIFENIDVILDDKHIDEMIKYFDNLFVKYKDIFNNTMLYKEFNSRGIRKFEFNDMLELLVNTICSLINDVDDSNRKYITQLIAKNIFIVNVCSEDKIIKVTNDILDIDSIIDVLGDLKDEVLDYYKNKYEPLHIKNV